MLIFGINVEQIEPSISVYSHGLILKPEKMMNHLSFIQRFEN